MTEVVITGIGTVGPLGLSVPEMWQNLLAGKSGIASISLFDTTGFVVKIAGEVKGYTPPDWIDRKDIQHMDRFTHFALTAMMEAIKQSGLELTDDLKFPTDLRDEVSILVGTGNGGLRTIVDQQDILRERGPGRVSPFTVPMLMVNAASGEGSIRFGARGPSFSVGSACASAADAIGIGWLFIKQGLAKVVVTGGSEASILPLTVAAFSNMRALTRSFQDEPEKASRPFDIGHDGFVIGEGAGILVLEAEDFARARGARMLAKLKGYGAASDSHDITAPDPTGSGAALAMQRALRNAEIDASQITYINAHGTSTPLNDAMETKAIRQVLGEYADLVPVSSTKGSLGHLVGAAPALEAVICVMARQTGQAPPTLNLDDPDPECNLNHIRGGPKEIESGVVMSNAFGFGGHNSVLLFADPDLER